jgi:hypothetical protein
MKKTILMTAIATAVMMSSAVYAEAKPDLRYFGGSTGGSYTKNVGGNLRDQLGGLFNFQINPGTKKGASKGTKENLKHLSDGSGDVASVQMDGLVGYSGSLEKLMTMYPEYVHLVCSKLSGVKSVKDLEGSDHVVAIGPRSGGTSVTWEAMGTLDDDYAEVQTKTYKYKRAASKMLSGDVACWMKVAGLGDSEVQYMATAGNGDFTLVPFNDWDFNDKTVKIGGKEEKLYNFDKIPGGTYGEALGNAGGWTGGDSIGTINVFAVLVASEEWIERMDEIDEDLIEEVYGASSAALPSIRAYVGYDPKD